MKVEAGAVDELVSSAQARKRRMARRNKATRRDSTSASSDHDDGSDYEDEDYSSSSHKRTRLDRDDNMSNDSIDSSSFSTSNKKKLTKDVLAKIPGVKQQARYVPAVSMTKEELTMWRKEARRVRNRESAAASRQKTQSRITELEEEVSVLTKKYESALKRIVELEAAAVGRPQDSASARRSRDVWTTPKISDDASSPVLMSSHTVSPPLSPRDEPSEFSRPQDCPQDCLSLKFVAAQAPAKADSSSSSTNTPRKYQQRQVNNFKISRPNACVKIPNQPRALFLPLSSMPLSALIAAA